jgi:phospholipid/cholesterol/gamma-HCH transport system ATP-binding protein
MVILYEGRVRADGTPGEFRDSDDPFVRQFVDGSPAGPIPVRWSKLEYETDLLA